VYHGVILREEHKIWGENRMLRGAYGPGLRQEKERETENYIMWNI
jgi:hypothetical protein